MTADKDPVLLLHGQPGGAGDWDHVIAALDRQVRAIAIDRPGWDGQSRALDLHYLFAPLKHARLDYMAQKAVEMGASRLQPIITRHVQSARVNLDRMRANVIEAAQQCGILTLPEIVSPLSFERMIAEREPNRLLVFCDEDAPVKDPVAALSAMHPTNRDGAIAIAVLIGPEGGFTADERYIAPMTFDVGLVPS